MKERRGGDVLEVFYGRVRARLTMCWWNGLRMGCVFVEESVSLRGNSGF